MSYYVCNGMGDSAVTPDEATLRKYLDDLDPEDEEHGAAWVCDEKGNCLEFDAYDRIISFSRENDSTPMCLNGMPTEQVLELWRVLIAGRLDELARLPWESEPRSARSAEERALRRREYEAERLRQDREFYDILGPERDGDRCWHDECQRGRMKYSSLCRVHHFENIKGRPCPFND